MGTTSTFALEYEEVLIYSCDVELHKICICFTQIHTLSTDQSTVIFW